MPHFSTDFMGKVVESGSVVPFSKNSKYKTSIVLEDEDGQRVRVVIWGARGYYFKSEFDLVVLLNVSTGFFDNVHEIDCPISTIVHFFVQHNEFQCPSDKEDLSIQNSVVHCDRNVVKLFDKTEKEESAAAWTGDGQTIVLSDSDPEDTATVVVKGKDGVSHDVSLRLSNDGTNAIT